MTSVDFASMFIGVVLLVAVFEYTRSARNANNITKLRISIGLWWFLLAAFFGAAKYTPLNLYSSSFVALIGCIYTMKIYFDKTSGREK